MILIETFLFFHFQLSLVVIYFKEEEINPVSAWMTLSCVRKNPVIPDYPAPDKCKSDLYISAALSAGQSLIICER